MIFHRFFDDKLAQASYLLGCVATGEALVVDANRDVEPYVRAAERDGLRIVAVSDKDGGIYNACHFCPCRNTTIINFN